MNKKKLLIMASIFPPQKNGGGPAVSISNLAKLLADDFEISVLSQNHEIGSDERLPGVTPCEWNKQDFGRVFYFDRGCHTVGAILEKIKEVAPDIIYQNSFFSYDQVLAVLRYKKITDKNVRVVIAPRGELGREKLKGGALKKRAYISFLSLFGYLNDVLWHGTGDEECADIKSAVHTRDNIFNIPNIPCTYGTPDLSPEKKAGELRLFYIARVQEIKNLAGAIKSLEKLRGRVTYDIYGPMEDKSYWQECEKEIAALPENITVSYKGFLEHSEVEAVAAAHHCLLLATKGENFGQTIADSMLNGRPCVISDMTPWRSLSESRAGFDCPLYDTDAYTKALQTLCDMESTEFSVYCRGAYDYILSRLDIQKAAADCKEMFGGKIGEAART